MNLQDLVRAWCYQGAEKPTDYTLNLDSPEQMNLLDLRAWCQTRGLYVKQEPASAKNGFRRQQSLVSSLVNPAAIYSAASDMMLETLKVNMERLGFRCHSPLPCSPPVT
jgi:hypothetical protein